MRSVMMPAQTYREANAVCPLHPGFVANERNPMQTSLMLQRALSTLEQSHVFVYIIDVGCEFEWTN
jgi:hypothetical protein